jgi:hypothetical protein
MRYLGKLEGIWVAIKADTLSLTALQVGMYRVMVFGKLWRFQKAVRRDT